MMYDQSSALIAVVLFACILLAIEAGFRIGRRARATVAESIKSQLNAIQAAVLGVLVLLLAFTFSLALQRYDSRSQAVVDEANAIGTAYLRSQLLPADMRNQASALLRGYLDVRVQSGKLSLADPAARAPLAQQAGEITEQLWRLARQAAEQDGGPAEARVHPGEPERPGRTAADDGELAGGRPAGTRPGRREGFAAVTSS